MGYCIVNAGCRAMMRWALLSAILAAGCPGYGSAAENDPGGDRKPSGISGDLSGGHAVYSEEFSSSLASRHLKPGGRIIGGATATQSLMVARTNNLASGDRLRGMALMSTDLDSGESCDTAFGIEYGNATAILGKIVGGYVRPYFGDRLSAGYQYWKLREKEGPASSHFIYGRWDHSSRAEWALTAMYGFPRKGRRSAGLLEFRMIDFWPVPGAGKTTRLVPLAGVAYGMNWFGAVHDGTVLTLGIGIRHELHRRVRLGLNLEGQRRLSGDKTKVPSKSWISASVDILH